MRNPLNFGQIETFKGLVSRISTDGSWWWCYCQLLAQCVAEDPILWTFFPFKLHPTNTMSLECTKKLWIYFGVLQIKNIIHTQQRDYSVCDCFTTRNVDTISNDENSPDLAVTFDDHEFRWLSIVSFQGVINFVILYVLKVKCLKYESNLQYA